jgi:hypothetical protein
LLPKEGGTALALRYPGAGGGEPPDIAFFNEKQLTPVFYNVGVIHAGLCGSEVIAVSPNKHNSRHRVVNLCKMNFIVYERICPSARVGVENSIRFQVLQERGNTPSLRINRKFQKRAVIYALNMVKEYFHRVFGGKLIRRVCAVQLCQNGQEKYCKGGYKKAWHVSELSF